MIGVLEPLRDSVLGPAFVERGVVGRGEATRFVAIVGGDGGG